VWDKYLRDHCELELIDVLKDYDLAIENRIIAVPALVVLSASSKRTLVGSLDDENELLRFLGIERNSKGKK